MGGNGIRAYELAKVLASEAIVTLAAPPSSGTATDIEQVPFDREDPAGLRAHLRGVDVVVTLPQNPVITAQLRRCGARIVYDMYDPKPLQMLEAFATGGNLRRRYWSTIALDHVMEALSVGDYFICASERQRDLWIGAMLAGGLITPAVYRADPTLRRRIDVVPFGVPPGSPRVDGPGPRERFELERHAEIVLWNGGLWNWLDPVCAVDAIAAVVRRRPRARLVFMGRPPAERHQARAATAARAHALALGLSDQVVFFNDSWVPYRERASWLLAADCALSLHVEHLETRFSFRTRLLDCFWAALPIVCTEGDELARLVARARLGATVPAGDPRAAAEAIVDVLESGKHSYGEALSQAAANHRWSAVAAPLLAYVRDPPEPLSDRVHARSSPGRLARSAGTRGYRFLLRARRRLGCGRRRLS